MNEQLKNLKKLEIIRFFDRGLNKIIEARYQGLDNKFGVFVRRLDNSDVCYINENTIISSSIIDDEMKKFDDAYDLKIGYRSCYNYLLSLQEATAIFLRDKCKLTFEILERNWSDAFDKLDYAYMIKEKVNKWGNSAKISFKKDEIKTEMFADLSKFFKIHDDTDNKSNFCIYNLYLALEILSDRKYK